MTSAEYTDQTIDLSKSTRYLLRHWWLYGMAMVAALSLAYGYVQWKEPVYLVSTTLLFQDQSTVPNDMAMFLEEASLLPTPNNLENEIGILRSYGLVYQTIQSLDFEVAYYEKTYLKTTEQYRSAPFIVQLHPEAHQIKGVPIQLKITSPQSYTLSMEEFGHVQQGQFGQPCSSPYYHLIIRKNFTDLPAGQTQWFFKINDLDKVTENYRNQLQIHSPGTGSSMLELSLTGELPTKNLNFLQRLCDTYAQNSLQEKTYVAGKTVDFITDQLGEVYDSLQGAESQLEQFRSEENVLDITSMAVSASERLASLEEQQAAIVVKRKYYTYLLDYLQDSIDVNSIVSPTSMGIEDALLNESLRELKQLFNDRVALNYTRTAKSRELDLLNLQIDNAKRSLIENAINLIESSKISLDDINQRVAEVRQIVEKLPENERDLRRIERKFTLSDNLYNYLLQKRAEANIAKASSRPDHKIVDQPRIVGDRPIAPNESFVYMLASVLALILPTVLLVAKMLLNSKITEVEQVEQHTSIPITGKIPQTKNAAFTMAEYPQSLTAEKFRALRMNLQYVYPSEKNHLVGVTSTVNGEGKSFCAFNLAIAIALARKKVILVEADLRQPKLRHFYSKLNSQVGLTDYLVGQATHLQVIQKTPVGLDIISSGAVPPNPLELLESPKLDELVESLKQSYDYIMFDLPPVGLVADYSAVAKHLGHTLFVVRLNRSKLHFLQDLNQDYQQGKYASKLSIIVNGVTKHSKRGYNQGYGYYYQNGKAKKKGKKLVTINQQK